LEADDERHGRHPEHEQEQEDGDDGGGSHLVDVNQRGADRE
jgi:hypothetical protein